MPILSCSVTDCDREAKTRSLCGMHYQRLRKHGSLVFNATDCGLCAKRFTPELTSAQKFCSVTCKNSAHRDSSKKSCSELGCDRPLRAKGMCSMHWKRAGRAAGLIRNEPWDERRKANYQKRRAQKLNLPADAVRTLDVYERDEWVCGLCSLPVDRELAYPDPSSASLDHILPLSKGGHHVFENVQLGHLSCNVRKGARVEADAMFA